MAVYTNLTDFIQAINDARMTAMVDQVAELTIGNQSTKTYSLSELDKMLARATLELARSQGKGRMLARMNRAT